MENRVPREDDGNFRTKGKNFGRENNVDGNNFSTFREYDEGAFGAWKYILKITRERERERERKVFEKSEEILRRDFLKLV